MTTRITLLRECLHCKYNTLDLQERELIIVFHDRDFFVANLFQVNILLEILRIEPLQSTYHIDLNGLLEAFNALQAKQKLSGTELVALDYYRYVQQRIVNGEPTDKHFTKVSSNLISLGPAI